MQVHKFLMGYKQLGFLSKIVCCECPATCKEVIAHLNRETDILAPVHRHP
jgi:hypothetical protein